MVSYFPTPDDSAASLTGNTWDEEQRSTELELIKVASWLKDNLISLTSTIHTQQTNLTMFASPLITHNIGKPTQPYKIQIHTWNSLSTISPCDIIPNFNEIKYLGTISDQRLS